MIVVLGWLAAAALISAVTYRLGGAAEDEHWYNFLKNNNLRIRDAGCSLIALGCMCWILKIHIPYWIHIIAFFLTFGALTTYWDRLFGHDNHYMHGGMIGLAYLPYAVAGAISWEMLALRVIVLALLMGIWSKLNGNAVWEECGRGAAIQVSLACYLI